MTEAMDCAGCKKRLQAYLDGELEGAVFAEVESHLARCEDCRAELDKLVKMRALLRELREVDVPAGEREAFIEALRERLQSEGVKVQTSPRVNLRPVLLGAIAVTALLIVVLLFPVQKEKPLVIGPAPGLNAIENARFDMIMMGGLGSHFLATQGDFLADPRMTGGQVLVGLRVLRDTHGDLLLPAE